MKKSLIAVAALAATSAFAQSSVSIYGLVDLAVHKDKDASAAMISGGVAGSRIGFKGTEDLGGGLKANFNLEQGFDAASGAAGTTDTGANASFSRQAWVGLSGGFGEVQVGKVWTAYDDIWGAANAVFDANALTPSKQVFLSSLYSDNPDQGVRYSTPVYNGFSGAISYSLDGSKAVKSNVTAFNVKYENGPIAAALGYQQDRQFLGDVNGGLYTKLTTVNGSYDFGVVKVMAGFTQIKEDASGDKAKEYTLGLDFPVSSNLILSAGYASSKADFEDKRSTAFSVGAAYLLSKRTTAYAGFSNANSVAVTERGAPDSRVAVGIKHTF